MKKIITKIAICILFYTLGFISSNIYIEKRNEKIKNSVLYQVKIDVEKINLRKEVDLNKSSIIKEVYKDEVFDVVKYFEGNSYNWYNIIYEEGKTGWIASGKQNSWVKVENKERCSNGK